MVFIGYQRLTIRYEAPRPFRCVPSAVSSRSAATKSSTHEARSNVLCANQFGGGVERPKRALRNSECIDECMEGAAVEQ